MLAFGTFFLKCVTVDCFRFFFVLRGAEDSLSLSPGEGILELWVGNGWRLAAVWYTGKKPKSCSSGPHNESPQ